MLEDVGGEGGVVVPTRYGEEGAVEGERQPLLGLVEVVV